MILSLLYLTDNLRFWVTMGSALEECFNAVQRISNNAWDVYIRKVVMELLNLK